MYYRHTILCGIYIIDTQLCVLQGMGTYTIYVICMSSDTKCVAYGSYVLWGGYD